MSSLFGKFLNRAPVPYSDRQRSSFKPVFKQKTSSEQALSAMGSVGTLFAILDKTTTAVAEVDWKLYRKAKSGKKEDRTEVTTHAALSVWNKPNPFMTQREFIEIIQQHMDLTGEMFWLTYSDNPMNIPLELWPVRPDKMEIIPDPVDYISGYIYTSPDGQDIPLNTDQVIFTRKPDPCSPYRGLGPVQTVLADLGLTQAAAEWSANFFRNSAEPGGIIRVDETLSDKEFNKMRDRWNESHKGLKNAHRVAILEHGQWVDRKYTMQEMQFTELRQVSREIIREAFSFPKPLLGTVDDTNRANMEAAEVTFARHTVRPRLDRIKDALNHEFLPKFGNTRDLEFDFEDPVEADQKQDAEVMKLKADTAKVFIDAGAKAESVVKALELPEMDWDRGGREKRPEPIVPLQSPVEEKPETEEIPDEEVSPDEEVV